MVYPSNLAFHEARRTFGTRIEGSADPLPAAAQSTSQRGPAPFDIYEDPSTPERISELARSSFSSSSVESPPLTGRGSITPPSRKRPFNTVELVAGINTKKVCRPKTANERRVEGFPLEAQAWISNDPSKIKQKPKLHISDLRSRLDLGPRWIDPPALPFPQQIILQNSLRLTVAQEAVLESLNEIDDPELLILATNPIGTGYGIGCQNSIQLNRFDESGTRNVKELKLDNFSVRSISWITDRSLIVGNESNHFIKIDLPESDTSAPAITPFPFSGDRVVNTKFLFATDKKEKQIAVVFYRPETRKITVDLLSVQNNPRQELDSKVLVEFDSQEEPTKVYCDENYVTIATPEQTFVLKLNPSQRSPKYLVSLNQEGKYKYAVTRIQPTKVWHRSNNRE